MRVEEVEILEALQSDIRNVSSQLSKLNSNSSNRKVSRKLVSTFAHLQEAVFTIREIIESIQKID